MNPNARTLSRRDPALASLMGIIGMNGSNFGAELLPRGQAFSPGDELAGDADPFGFGADDMGEDDVGFGFGADDYGADDMGARRRRAPAANALQMQQAQQVWAKAKQRHANSQRRNKLLNPNEDSSIKIEKYAFSLSNTIVLGTAVAFTTLTGQPDTSIRPQRVTCNAPSVMFAFFQEIKVANVSVTVGSGLEDAFNYGALGVGQSLDMPTLSPANRATVLGSYSGFVPPGFVNGTSTTFTVTFKGPATIAA